MINTETATVGKSEPRKDGWDKVTGKAMFLDDIPLEGCWYGGVLRSSVTRGILKGLDMDPSFDWSKVTVVTAKDLPGPNMVASVRNDCPILADEKVSYVTEPIALVAAPDKNTLKEALKGLHPVIEPDGEPVLDVFESLKAEKLVWGQDNVLQTFDIRRGDLEKGFKDADYVFEGTYTTQHQEQVYLEPQSAFAVPASDLKGVEITISCQCPFYVHNSVVQGLGFDPERVVIRQSVTGGGFGGKEFYPSLLALQCAVLALASRKTVKIVFDREEDLSSTSKRHPSVTRIKSGHKKDGSITAMDIDFILNGGATTTLSVVVLQRGVLHATGCYRVPNVRVLGRAVATNLPPSGAYRGFGVPQSMFALERHMDKVASKLGISPLEIRKINILKAGDILPCGQKLNQAAAEEVMERAIEISGYRKKWDEYEKSNKGPSTIKKGIGMSLFLHGGAFTGSGEDFINGKAKVVFLKGEAKDEDKIQIRIASTEMGQGSSTVLSQIVAEALSLPLDRVEYLAPDTSLVLNSGPTVASRTTVVVGAILKRAASDMAKKLTGLKFPWTPEEFFESARDYEAKNGALEGLGSYVSTGSHWDDASNRGDAYPSYSWACDVVEVEVDSDTLEIVPTKFYAVLDIGTVINPVLAEGQYEGGSLQALGYGYLEDMKVKGGRIDASSLSKYLIPTAMDSPEFEVGFLECPYEHGPYGAKGLGELPHDGGAPALAQAIGQALGIFPSDIPVTPERITAMMGQKEGQR